MKVIFTSDVESVGRIGETKEVKEGFARNYLFPKKLAVEATETNIKQWEQKKQAIKKKEDQAKAEAEGLAASLQRVSPVIRVKVGEEDRLFGSVTPQNISDALHKLGFDIPKKDIEVETPIKALGVYEVPVKLHHSVTVNVKVEVAREE